MEPGDPSVRPYVRSVDMTVPRQSCADESGAASSHGVGHADGPNKGVVRLLYECCPWSPARLHGTLVT